MRNEKCHSRLIRACIPAAAALVCLVGLSLPAGAIGKAKPKVSWTLPRTASEGAVIPFSWSGSSLSAEHRLVIQRPVGTARTWRTIQRLGGNRGRAKLSGLPLGKYRLRIAAIAGGRVLAQQVRSLAVFGPVPFSTLFNDHQDKSHVTPQFTFPYVLWYYGDETPLFNVDRNNCLSVHIDFVALEYKNPSAPGTAILTLVQESREAISASAAYSTLGALDAPLTPGQSWAVNASHVSSGPSPKGYINGFAVCNSREPFS